MILFRVTGTDVYIFGSMHLLKAAETLPLELFSLVSTSDDCIFESDLDHQTEPPFAVYGNDESLRDHITAELYAATARLCGELNLPLLLPQRKPWWVALVLGIHTLLRAGLNVTAGADRQLWDYLQSLGRRPYTLETPDVLRAFDAAPLPEQVRRLEMVVQEPTRGIKVFEAMHKAWRQGDTAVLDEQVEEQMSLFPQTTSALLDTRNREWLPKLISAIRLRRRALFIVGLLHLAGPSALQVLLQEAGYSTQSAVGSTGFE